MPAPSVQRGALVYDIQASKRYQQGQNPFHFALRGPDAEEITGCWSGLLPAATDIEVPMGQSFSCQLFGTLTDRFGVIWIIDVEVPFDPS